MASAAETKRGPDAAASYPYNYGDTVDRRTSDRYAASVRFPDSIRHRGSDRSLPLSLSKPDPASCGSAGWPHSASNGVNHDGPPGGHSGSIFTPWVNSTPGSRAWNAADEAEAIGPTHDELRLTTRPRWFIVGICCMLYLATAVMLIVAQTGSTSTRQSSTDIYLFRLNLTVLFDNPKPGDNSNSSNAALSNVITESMGLQNYYQSGLWGYCQGGDVSPFTVCSTPQAFFWFNPAGVLLGELLQNSTVTIPVRVTTVLTVLRVVSKVMFGTYFVGMILAAVLAFASPLVLFSRWWSVPICLLAATTAFPLFVGSALATALALTYRLVGSGINELTIIVTMGETMLALVWTATALSLIAFVLHAILAFSGTSVRDIKTGRRAYIRLPSPETTTTPAEKAIPGAPRGLQTKGSAIVTALKKKVPWLTPLTMHTLVTRDQIVPVTPLAGQQPPTYPNETPVWGVVT